MTALSDKVGHFIQVLKVQVGLLRLSSLLLVAEVRISGVCTLPEVDLLLLSHRCVERRLERWVLEQVGDVRVVAVSRKCPQAAKGWKKLQLVAIRRCSIAGRRSGRSDRPRAHGPFLVLIEDPAEVLVTNGYTSLLFFDFGFSACMNLLMFQPIERPKVLMTSSGQPNVVDAVHVSISRCPARRQWTAIICAKVMAHVSKLMQRWRC